MFYCSDRIAHRTDGRRQSAAEDRPTVPAHLLAAGPQGADFHQLAGRTHEHGREVETEDRLRARRGRVTVSVHTLSALSKSYVAGRACP